MEDPFETVWELATEEEAALVAGKLEAEGFPCVLESRLFRAEPVTFGALGTVAVRVPRELAEEALQLLRAQEGGVPISDSATE